MRNIRLRVDEIVYLTIGEVMKENGVIFDYATLFDRIETFAKEKKLIKLYQLEKIPKALNKMAKAKLIIIHKSGKKLTRNSRISVTHRYKTVEELIKRESNKRRKGSNGALLLKWKKVTGWKTTNKIIQYLDTLDMQIFGLRIFPVREIVKELRMDESVVLDALARAEQLGFVTMFKFPTSNRVWIALQVSKLNEARLKRYV